MIQACERLERQAAYPMFEVELEWTACEENPFAADVWVRIEEPGGQVVAIPAFYDGGQTWRARFTPRLSGVHRAVEMTGPGGEPLTGARVAGPDEFEASGQPTAGFMRVSAQNPRRFALDDGTPYFPLGQNLAWISVAAYPEFFAKLRACGQNWARVWMVDWNGLALDWVMNQRLPEGELDLEAARRWDAIVQAAEQNGIYFQMVLQCHGQYSSFLNSIWAGNPLNAANGGCLENAADFFTGERARELTRIKYRYIAARWGYSPAIMAWELFNEVQYTDAFAGPESLAAIAAFREHAGNPLQAVLSAGLAWQAVRRPTTPPLSAQLLAEIQQRLMRGENLASYVICATGDMQAIADWHNEMAGWLRAHDPNGHLVTTSNPPLDSPIWEAMDYVQLHEYVHDMIVAVSRLPQGAAQMNRPVFWGEIGDHEIAADDKADGRYMHSMMWAGLVSGASGAAQMWAWDRIEQLGFYDQYRALRQFVDGAGLDRLASEPLTVRVQDAPATGSQAALEPLGILNEQGAALWVYNPAGIHADSPPQPVQATLRLEGLEPAGFYEVQWHATDAGFELLAMQAGLRADEGGALILPTLPIARDAAGFVRRRAVQNAASTTHTLTNE